MDIHPPIGRAESLKEILTHIFIVTVGILIALSLEGVRESWREHVIANEVRESTDRFETNGPGVLQHMQEALGESNDKQVVQGS
jgi:hypothetical protein